MSTRISNRSTNPFSSSKASGGVRPASTRPTLAGTATARVGNNSTRAGGPPPPGDSFTIHEKVDQLEKAAMEAAKRAAPYVAKAVVLGVEIAMPGTIPLFQAAKWVKEHYDTPYHVTQVQPITIPWIEEDK